MMVTRLDWSKYGHVIASEHRKKVVLCLRDGAKTPKQIAEETELYLSHVSKVVGTLVDKGVAKCLTPELRRGKIFGLTREGKEIVKHLKKLEQEHADVRRG